MKNIKNIGFFTVLFSLSAIASECWITDGYQGHGAKAYENFKVNPDGMTSTKYVIVVDGDKSKVLDNPISFIQVSANSILGLDIVKGKSVVETWSVFPSEKKAIYTKTVNGYGVYDGAAMFVGKVVGSCNSEKKSK